MKQEKKDRKSNDALKHKNINLTKNEAKSKKNIGYFMNL